MVLVVRTVTTMTGQAKVKQSFAFAKRGNLFWAIRAEGDCGNKCVCVCVCVQRCRCVGVEVAVRLSVPGRYVYRHDVYHFPAEMSEERDG